MAESNESIVVELRAIVNQFTGAFKDAFGVASTSLAKFGEDIKQAHAHSVEGTDGIRGAFGNLTGVIEHFGGILGGVLGILAGGKIFHEFITQVREAATETDKLNRIYGMTSDETNTLGLASRMVGSSLDQMMGGINRLARSLKTNETALNAMGLVTRDSNKNFLDTSTILANTGVVLEKYTPGMSRLEAATKMFGRNTELVNAVMRMTPTVLAEAEAFHKSLNVTIGMEGVAAYQKYEGEMAKAGEVANASSYTMGQAILPTLTKIAEKFNEYGPKIVGIIKWIAEQTVIWGSALLDVFYIAEGVTKAIYDAGGAFGALIAGMASGNPKEAWAAFKQGGHDAKQALKEIQEQMHQNYEDTQLQLFVMREIGETPLPKPEGGITMPAKPEKHVDQLGEWTKELKYLEDTTRGTFENNDKFEQEYWLNLQQNATLTYDELRGVTSKYFDSTKKVLEGEEHEWQVMHKVEVDVAKGKYGQLVTLANEFLEHQRMVYGSDSKQATDALHAQMDAQFKFYQDKQKLAAEAVTSAQSHTQRLLENEQSTLSSQVELGIINEQQMLQINMNLENEIYASKLAALNEKLALNALEIDETKKLHEEIKKLEDDHAKILVKSQYDSALATKKAWDQILSPISSAFASSMQGVIMGTQTWKAAWNNMLTSMVGSFLSMGVTMAKDWAVKTAGRMGLDRLWAANKATTETSAAVEAAAVGKASAYSVASGYAIEGAIAAGASAAAIPLYGWMIAPDVFASTLALFEGAAAGIGVAAKGAVVPADMLIMAHKDEMILPPALSEGVQDMIEGGSGKPGGDTHIHISALDSKSVERLFKNNASALVNAWKAGARQHGMANR